MLQRSSPKQPGRSAVRSVASVLLALAAVAVPHADDWPAPTIKEVFSESRDWFVRVVPGKSLGDTFGFAGAPKGPYARALFYRQRRDLSYGLVAEMTTVNPIAPVDFVVTDLRAGNGRLATVRTARWPASLPYRQRPPGVAAIP